MLQKRYKGMTFFQRRNLLSYFFHTRMFLTQSNSKMPLLRYSATVAASYLSSKQIGHHHSLGDMVAYMVGAYKLVYTACSREERTRI